jgi:hypothetical protein
LTRDLEPLFALSAIISLAVAVTFLIFAIKLTHFLTHRAQLVLRVLYFKIAVVMTSVLIGALRADLIVLTSLLMPFMVLGVITNLITNVKRLAKALVQPSNAVLQ